MEIFNYGQKELDYLKRKDKRLGEIIERIGLIERQVTPDLFEALVECIVSQQISNKAAETVSRRLKELLIEFTPENVAKTNHFDIQRCGMSLKKASYIKIAADAVLSGTVNLDHFPQMKDEEIIEQLISLPGIGIWTAEMLMIFSLQRLNILSYDDLIIRRGIMKLYEHTELTKELFEKYKKRYSPYGSIASLYLWELAQKPEVELQ